MTQQFLVKTILPSLLALSTIIGGIVSTIGHIADIKATAEMEKGAMITNVMKDMVCFPPMKGLGEIKE